MVTPPPIVKAWLTAVARVLILIWKMALVVLSVTGIPERLTPETSSAPATPAEEMMSWPSPWATVANVVPPAVSVSSGPSVSLDGLLKATSTSAWPEASVALASEKSPVIVWPAIVAVRFVALTENAAVAVSMLTDTAAADRLTPVALTVTAPASAPFTSVCVMTRLPVRPVTLASPPPSERTPFFSAMATLGVAPVVTVTVTSPLSVWPRTDSVAPVAATWT